MTLDLKLSDEEINDAMIHEPGIGSHGRAIANAATAKAAWWIAEFVEDYDPTCWGDLAEVLEAAGIQKLEGEEP